MIKKNSPYRHNFALLSFYNTFYNLSIKTDYSVDQDNLEKLNPHETQIYIGKSWFKSISSLSFLCLYKLNSHVKSGMATTEKSCDDIILFLKNQEISENLQDLIVEKKSLLQINERRPFFFTLLFTCTAI